MLKDYDYSFPKTLIAQEPVEPRDDSRLLVVKDGFKHRRFYHLSEYLERGDALVVNDSRVSPLKFHGIKSETGGKVEVLFLGSPDSSRVKCLIKGKRVRIGTKLELEGGGLGTVTAQDDRFFTLELEKAPLEENGEIPLPPYIKSNLKDLARYQTVYSDPKGSIAAPTAGLHFTDRLLQEIVEKGVSVIKLTLHVGYSTFRPLSDSDLTSNPLGDERLKVSKGAASELSKALDDGGRVFAVGTTVLKSLETIGDRLEEYDGVSQLFINHGYQPCFPLAGLITNFHLPGSPNLLMVSTIFGRARVLEAYKEAVKKSYRLASFGDAMLIFK